MRHLSAIFIFIAVLAATPWSALAAEKDPCAPRAPAGKGDGMLAASLNPSPRNLTNPQFKQCKSAGEMFWAVKNGIPGTGMIAAVDTGLISEEEAWQAVLYERSLK